MKQNNSIDLWSIHLPDYRNELEHFRSLLNGEEVERASKFFKPKDAERFVLCRGLLRRILGKALKREPSSISFNHNEHGKPFLPDTELEFNVSHSRDRLLVAVTAGRSVGVDIEFRRDGVAMNSIAKRWFSPDEQAFLQGSEKPKETFFDIWAEKEAYMKALGLGIFHDLNSFTVPLGKDPFLPMFGKNKEWFFQTLEIDPAYAAAIVSEAPSVPIQLRTI